VVIDAFIVSLSLSGKRIRRELKRIRRELDTVVAVAFQIIFCAEMHVNDVYFNF
jgi:hypothetical protein